MTGFETDARRTARRVSPRVATVASARVTPAAANGTSQASIWRKASTARDTTPAMERRLISGHSPFEPVAGFSRAVVVGSTVHVAGTAPIPPDGSPTPESAYEQARLCLSIIAEALERAGASRRRRRPHADVRHRCRRTGATSRAPTARSFREVRPAATCVVTSLLDPSWKVEIEAEAVIR